MHAAIHVAGFPSRYGGADTELDHLLDLLRSPALDVRVTLVPMFGADPEMRASVAARGIAIEEFRPDVFAGRTVLSFCNGEFLNLLPVIMRSGRPRRVVWFNCMTATFERERAAHRAGWIDVFGFVSRFQERLLRAELEPLGPVATFPYRPYFNTARVAWQYRRWDGSYRLGRISRDDGAKFAKDTWRIFDRVLVPSPLAKKVYLLGYGPNAAAKIGPAPWGLDWRTWSPDEIPSEQLYRTIDTMVHKTGGSRESYCRVLVEAYAHGVVPIVEDAYAFPELVVHGETGFLARTSDEMSYYASVLAHEPDRHHAMAVAGRRHLEALVDPERCAVGWRELLDDA